MSGVRADVRLVELGRAPSREKARTLIMAGEVFIATDDGSAGFHGMVTDLMRDLIDRQGKRYDEVIAIGPMIMMKFVARTTKEYGIRTIVSLNTLMVDGTGMCGACRVTVGGRTRLVLFARALRASRAPSSTVMRSISTRPCAVRACTRRSRAARPVWRRSGPRATPAASDSIDDVKPAPDPSLRAGFRLPETK